ncbi:coiled-coil domain-containing protein 78 isoform X7 [Prinia subflava]|uniref:coiled-coil domain-containing protein 78 isoform X7 n=1 Tax=Prinia subflava TaxID=208062 RepID=UPI002FE0225F
MDLGIVAENENVQLEHRNQEMQQLGDPQEEMGKLLGSQTDLPARVVLSEEEKLKMSKDLVDLQIETNKMKEHYETENFKLKNMMQALESRVQELELGSARVTGERDSLRERLRALESGRQELAEEFIILKSNYLALGRELDQEVMRNEELTQELLSLAKESIHPPGLAHQSSPELGRGRAEGHPHSAQRGKPEAAAASEHEQQELEGNLLGNQDHIKVELEKLKKTHDEQQQKLEERVLALGKELQEAKGAAGHRLAEQSAVLLTSQGQLQEVEAENSRLQLRLKELNEEYRSRLARYLRDLAVAAGADPGPGEQCHGLRPCRAPLLHHRPRAADKELPGAEPAAPGKGKAGGAAPGTAEENPERNLCLSSASQAAAGGGGLGRGHKEAPRIHTQHPGASGAGEKPAAGSGCGGRGAGVGAAGVH